MAIGKSAPKVPGGGIKQMKGPGENLGIKKPRKPGFIPKPKPFKQSRSMTDAMSPEQSGSYLPTLAGGGKVVSRKQR